jgi:hypothetical protein
MFEVFTAVAKKNTVSDAMWLLTTGVSNERTTSIIRLEMISELVTLAVTNRRCFPLWRRFL